MYSSSHTQTNNNINTSIPLTPISRIRKSIPFLRFLSLPNHQTTLPSTNSTTISPSTPPRLHPLDPVQQMNNNNNSTNQDFDDEPNTTSENAQLPLDHVQHTPYGTSLAENAPLGIPFPSFSPFAPYAARWVGPPGPPSRWLLQHYIQSSYRILCNDLSCSWRFGKHSASIFGSIINALTDAMGPMAAWSSIEISKPMTLFTILGWRDSCCTSHAFSFNIFTNELIPIVRDAIIRGFVNIQVNINISDFNIRSDININTFPVIGLYIFTRVFFFGSCFCQN